MYDPTHRSACSGVTILRGGIGTSIRKDKTDMAPPPLPERRLRRALWCGMAGAVAALAAPFASMMPVAAQTLDAVEYDLCTIAPERRVETAQQQLKDAWYDLDVHGRAFTGGFNPHSANFGQEPIRPGTSLAQTMEWRHVQIQRLMVKLGALFPHFNRPMDVPALSARMWSRSVPASYLFDPRTAMLEAFLTASDDNGSIGFEFVEAMGDLEGELLALTSGQPAPPILASMARFQEAFPRFMAAVREVVSSASLAEALTWRMAHVCEKEGTPQLPSVPQPERREPVADRAPARP